MPDAYSLTLEAELTTPMAEMLGVSGDFDLLNTLPQVGTISGTVLSSDTNFDGSLSRYFGPCVCVCPSSFWTGAIFVN